MLSGQDLNVFVVAGEESGDRLGAALVAALKRATQGRVRFAGVGGAQMRVEGVETLFPIDELSMIGFASMPARLPKILARIRQTAEAAVAARPDVLVIIDCPEFTHRVARKVREHDPTIPIVDYVCPSVWAWRPGRARRMRGYVDHVLALLPFEPEVMERLDGPPTTFVGHPLSEQVALLRPNPEEARQRMVGPPLLLVLPGSRTGEIRRMADIFGNAVEQIAAVAGPIEVVVPAVRRLADLTQAATAKWAMPVTVAVDAAAKHAAMRKARAALTKSGTSTLELALAGVPMAAAYKVPLIEEIVGRLLITAKSAILTNLILGENVVPEFLQRDCKPAKLAQAVLPLLSDTPQRRRQVDAFARLNRLMEIGRESPSDRAASLVIDCTRGRAQSKRRPMARTLSV